MFRARMNSRFNKQKTTYLIDNVSIILKLWSLMFVLIVVVLFFIAAMPNMNITAIVLFFACTFIFTLSFIWMYTKIYLPHKEMERAVHKFNVENDFSYLRKCEVYYSEELEKTFSRMLDLFEKVNAIRTTDVHAEYRALQNQINPHFLYNTLEAIRSDALCEGADNVANITEALATFFRYTISNVNSLVTLEAELSNSETYFTIQKYRFGDKVELRISIDDENLKIMESQIPKLTLQPIIENSIMHGIEPKLGGGTIDIEIEAVDERLIIRITDDGIGMEENVLSRLKERLDDRDDRGIAPDLSVESSIGLFNVNSRIKLEFGEIFGLRIKSIKNFGTSVEIVLPLITEKNKRT